MSTIVLQTLAKLRKIQQFYLAMLSSKKARVLMTKPWIGHEWYDQHKYDRNIQDANFVHIEGN